MKIKSCITIHRVDKLLDKLINLDIDIRVLRLYTNDKLELIDITDCQPSHYLQLIYKDIKINGFPADNPSHVFRYPYEILIEIFNEKYVKVYKKGESNYSIDAIRGIVIPQLKEFFTLIKRSKHD